jgi:glycosyltransferase involved in cell wall biosynthesis
MPTEPVAIVVIPVYNRARTLARCVHSALRQRQVRLRVVIADHGSTDGSAQIAAGFAEAHENVRLLSLARLPGEPKSPSRPLNEGFAAALASAEVAERTWVFRLDADDFLTSDEVIASQLRAGRDRELIMATLTFFDPARRSAYEYGPRLGHRSLRGLPGRDVYAVAHHATAMRADLLSCAWQAGVRYDPELETGEDLGVTCGLIRLLGGAEERFAFVPVSYCFKELDEQTITGSLPLRRVWASHRKLLRSCRELSSFAVLRGLAELGLSRVVGESCARRSLQHVAGRNGHYQAVAYSLVADRLQQLSAAVGPSADIRSSDRAD